MPHRHCRARVAVYWTLLATALALFPSPLVAQDGRQEDTRLKRADLHSGVPTAHLVVRLERFRVRKASEDSAKMLGI